MKKSVVRDEISDRQRVVMEFIEEHIQQFGYPPTNREIGTHMSIPSTGHIDYHLKALEGKGYIQRDSRTSRSIRVLISLRKDNESSRSDFMAANGIRIMGSIAAGEPLDLYSGQNDILDCVNPSIFSSNAYALRVRGESMIEDGIFDGDFVVIEPNITPHTRDIIVATNTIGGGEGGAATLKRFFQEGKRIRLQPANKSFNPIYVDAKEWDQQWQVQGRVASVIRMYQYNS